MLSTVIGIGETGMGKSSFLNAYLQKMAFLTSDHPDSCTKLTRVDSNIINNQTRNAIDTPGIKDTDNTDQENVRQLVQFLLNYKYGINVVAIVLNGQNDRFTKDTEKFIKIAHQMFNHPDFWDHLCIVFTKWYMGMTEGQKRTKKEYYKEKVIGSIRIYTDSIINIELPMFFVDSLNYINDAKTKTELDRFNDFAFSRNSMKTTQVTVPNVFYEKVIPEKKFGIKYNEYISEDQMKKIEYFADQSRQTLVDYYGNKSHTEWRNDREWEIEKTKKIYYEDSGPILVGTDTFPIFENESTNEELSGVLVTNNYEVCTGNKTIRRYEIRRRKVTIDFDGNKIPEEWEVINSYEEESTQKYGSSRFRLYKYYKATSHNHPLKYLDRTMNNGWSCNSCLSTIKDIDKPENFKRFICMQCNYNLCEKCMDEYYDKYYTIKNDNSNNRNLYLFEKPYYSKLHDDPLIFLDKSKDNGWICKGKELEEKKCFSDINDSKQSSGIPRFRCDKCNFDLCENCMNHYRYKPAFKLNQSYNVKYDKHPLVYMAPSDTDWVCDGRKLNEKCFSDINDFGQTKGFERFRCEKCDYDLCRNCMDYYSLDKNDSCPIF